MKKLVFASFFAFILTVVGVTSVVPAPALAQQSTLTSSSCLFFNRDLTLNSEGSDVVELQNRLIAAGHLVMPLGVAKGYFGNLTRQAVIRWQVAQGITPAFGYFGPLTRGRINSLGCGNQSVPTVKVTSPNGGERWVDHEVEDITWNPVGCAGCQYFARYNPAIDIYLKRQSANAMCREAGGTICPQDADMMPYVLDKNIKSDKDSYSWIVATDINDKAISAGWYKVQICVVGSTTDCDYSDQAFEIVSQDESNSLRITSPNGGERWGANTDEIIRWTASPLPRRVDLSLESDPNYCPPGYACAAIYREPVIYILEKNISRPQGEYGWIVATDVDNKVIPAGRYRVKVCAAGSTTECDGSDRSFEIIPDSEGTILTIQSTGGMCQPGTCGSKITIKEDGSFIQEIGSSQRKEGRLRSSVADRLATLIEETDYRELRKTPFTGTCPIAYDGNEYTYTFETSRGTQVIKSCTTEIDWSDDLFVEIRKVTDLINED